MAETEEDVVVSKRISAGRGQWVIFAVLVLVAATIIYPLYFVIFTSLRPNSDYLQDPFGLPGVWTLDNYIKLAVDYGIGQAFLNSLFVASVSVAVILTLASLAGYALAKLPVPGTKYITATFVSVMLIPGPVLIIPIYVMLARLELVGSYAGLILVYIATGLPLDLTMVDPCDGHVDKSEKRERARKLIRRQRPYMLIASPRCVLPLAVLEPVQ